jgi:hypothetical protein
MLDVTQTYFICDTNVYEEPDRNHVEIVATSIDIDKLAKIRFSETLVFITFIMWEAASIPKANYS